MTTATKTAAHIYKVGDILYSSWGYDQTNINFYEVVKATASTVTLWPMGKLKTYNGHMSGTVVPTDKLVLGSNAKAIRRKASGDNSIRISDYEYAHLWDGKPKGFTEYA